MSLCVSSCHALNKTMKETFVIIPFYQCLLHFSRAARSGPGRSAVSGCVLSWDGCNTEPQQGEAGSCLSIYISPFSNNTELWTSQSGLIPKHHKTLLCLGLRLLLVCLSSASFYLIMYLRWNRSTCYQALHIHFLCSVNHHSGLLCIQSMIIFRLVQFHLNISA